MTLAQFKISLKGTLPPDKINALLLSLWYDAKGNWNRAHETAQDITGRDGSWIHAYLHRKEGDLSNASYWYSIAGKPIPSSSLEEEWENILKALIGRA